ncbi:MAG: molybdenum cofactor guanylyltransferase [Lentisphaerae bacterium]|jgi:molybdenum cofactor guanylyltransferase|nr:molybdenum cofactor guanylyltransferase [Lentisphaerota bacterium]MBT4814856.1 molybdenum cofactor guanylyltransferase [Lentisphaerota bacterium]MBT5612638.1 molybdenum cofactor guanylyltransferase [Lentisphaerota bacterium]MBT7057359.1 molybdenum cofactor guanylyltransferase [Lentisphaerota bacterium]MBT7846457.1 molybdenum cofactor guanylyltransferase [Lentisphaerota bacterium]
MKHAKDTAAIVLAGGRSGRMGSDKALLPVNGIPLLQHILEQLRLVLPRVIVSANDPDRYPFLDCQIVPDRVPDRGPLMGIASAITASGCRHNLVVACDIPVIDHPFIATMLSESDDYDCVVPRTADGYLEPLFAVYRDTALPIANGLLARGVRRASALCDHCRARQVPLPPSLQLHNLNTSTDYDAFVAELSR